MAIRCASDTMLHYKYRATFCDRVALLREPWSSAQAITFLGSCAEALAGSIKS
jgi:hypothetical protein